MMSDEEFLLRIFDIYIFGRSLDISFVNLLPVRAGRDRGGVESGDEQNDRGNNNEDEGREVPRLGEARDGGQVKNNSDVQSENCC